MANTHLVATENDPLSFVGSSLVVPIPLGWHAHHTDPQQNCLFIFSLLS
jgi:hypothetical protein